MCALLRQKSRFKKRIFFQAQLLTCNVCLLAARFCSDAAKILQIEGFFGSLCGIWCRVRSWLNVLPQCLLFIPYVFSGTAEEWMVPSVHRCPHRLLDGSDRPVSSLPHPPITAAHTALMTTSYLFHVTISDFKLSNAACLEAVKCAKWLQSKAAFKQFNTDNSEVLVHYLSISILW